MKPGVGSTEGLIAVMCYRVFKIIGAAEIVFCSCAADGRIFPVVIQIKFDFAFSPPSAVIDPPSHICPNIMAMTVNTICKGINRLVGKGICPAELGMKIGAVLWELCQSIINLIIISHPF